MEQARMALNPYLRCRQTLGKTEHQILEFSGAHVKMCGRVEPAIPGIWDGDGIRLHRFCKMPGIPRIRAKLKPFCIQEDLTGDLRRADMALRSRLIIRAYRSISLTGIKKCIQIRRCGRIPDKSVPPAAQTG